MMTINLVVKRSVDAMTKALRNTCLSLPHLAVLIKVIDIRPTTQIYTVGISRCGRLAVNPLWFFNLNHLDQAFIAAHEVLHLALFSHDRSIGSDPTLFNIAHDFIINDILVDAFQHPIPANGCELDGARYMSAEQLMLQLAEGLSHPSFSWRIGNLYSDVSLEDTALSNALRKAGLSTLSSNSTESVTTSIKLEDCDWDLLTDDQERELFPDIRVEDQKKHSIQIKRIAIKTANLSILHEKIDHLYNPGRGGNVSSRSSAIFDAVNWRYRPLWDEYLCRWLENTIPGNRTYSKASRRSGNRTDIVLLGRQREAWMLHLVLDTSGSMTSELPIALGAIAAFAQAANLSEIHVLQSSDEITADEYVTPEALTQFQIHGMGGSDMTPAMEYLAKDPDVTAIVLITDGYINIPDTPPPYAVLWVLTSNNIGFTPRYGHKILVTT